MWRHIAGAWWMMVVVWLIVEMVDLWSCLMVIIFISMSNCWSSKASCTIACWLCVGSKRLFVAVNSSLMGCFSRLVKKLSGLECFSWCWFETMISGTCWRSSTWLVELNSTTKSMQAKMWLKMMIYALFFRSIGRWKVQN